VSSDTQFKLSDQTRCLLYTTTDTFMHYNLLMWNPVLHYDAKITDGIEWNNGRNGFGVNRLYQSYFPYMYDSSVSQTQCFEFGETAISSPWVIQQVSTSFAINSNQKPIWEKGKWAMHVIVSGMMYYTWNKRRWVWLQPSWHRSVTCFRASHIFRVTSAVSLFTALVSLHLYQRF
jgi:hypothetical protein